MVYRRYVIHMYVGSSVVGVAFWCVCCVVLYMCCACVMWLAGVVG